MRIVSNSKFDFNNVDQIGSAPFDATDEYIQTFKLMFKSIKRIIRHR